MALAPIPNDDLIDCPWGCGLAVRHTAAAVCPPQFGNGNWANSVSVALGTPAQLRGDAVVLRNLMTGADCAACRKLLQRRLTVVQQRLNLIG